jgi:hypothetical protein
MLSAEQVAAIQARYVPQHVPLRVLMSEFGISMGTAHRVVSGVYRSS